MNKVIELRSAYYFEGVVFEAAPQLLDELDWSEFESWGGIHAERPAEWPLSDKRLNRPHGRPGKFHGLTYTPREFLKRHHRHHHEIPPLLQFGLTALAWWHREVWRSAELRNASHQSFEAYVRAIIPKEGKAFGCEGELRMLYSMPSVESAEAAA